MCLEDEEARGLEHSSRKKSRTLLERQFLPFCEARKFIHLDQILPIDLTEFRSTWNNGEATTHRKHERMHSFFAFCVANDMLRKNPMDALKKHRMSCRPITSCLKNSSRSSLPPRNMNTAVAMTMSIVVNASAPYRC